jgi:hypothetical protein
MARSVAEGIDAGVRRGADLDPGDRLGAVCKAGDDRDHRCGGGLAPEVAAVLLYRYVDVGAIGPLPDMYHLTCNPEETLSVIAEGVVVLAALVLGRGQHSRSQGTAREVLRPRSSPGLKASATRDRSARSHPVWSQRPAG